VLQSLYYKNNPLEGEQVYLYLPSKSSTFSWESLQRWRLLCHIGHRNI